MCFYPVKINVKFNKIIIASIFLNYMMHYRISKIVYRKPLIYACTENFTKLCDDSLSLNYGKKRHLVFSDKICPSRINLQTNH